MPKVFVYLMGLVALGSAVFLGLFDSLHPSAGPEPGALFPGEGQEAGVADGSQTLSLPSADGIAGNGLEVSLPVAPDSVRQRRHELAASISDLKLMRIKLAKQLEFETQDAFEDKWRMGEFVTVETLLPHHIQDEERRPLPNSGRLTAGGLELVVLTRDDNAPAVDLIQTIGDLDKEISALELEAHIEE